MTDEPLFTRIQWIGVGLIVAALIVQWTILAVVL